MSAAVCELGGERQGRKGRVGTVGRGAAGGRYVGGILLDARGRVWRHADTIPADVVLKTLVAVRRQTEVCGRFVGRTDGRVYLWYVVGAVPEAGAAPAA